MKKLTYEIRPFSTKVPKDLLKEFLRVNEKTGISQTRLIQEGMKHVIKKHSK